MLSRIRPGLSRHRAHLGAIIIADAGGSPGDNFFNGIASFGTGSRAGQGLQRRVQIERTAAPSLPAILSPARERTRQALLHHMSQR